MTTMTTYSREAPLIGASRLLAQRGFFGVVWVDAELTATARYGSLTDFVQVGEDVTSSILPFVGLEKELRSLSSTPDAVLDIPSVRIFHGSERTPRLNLAALWSDNERAIIVHVSRAVHSTDLEVELNRQIRARLIAEADVTAKSLELQQANADLEQFAAVISHDLKAPMRELRHLTDDAEALLASGNVAAARQVLSAARRQSTRMSTMLTSLLSYATATRKADALEEVDTGELVRAIVASLPTRPGHRIEISGHWPRLTTFVALLDLVLRNVIHNALAHHDRDQGSIRILAHDLDANRLHICVTDDGPGIHPADHRSIFLPFRTLQPSDDGQPGGMGLAIVARALATVGGRIDVISDAPKTRGASFQFCWPKTTVTTTENCSTYAVDPRFLGA